LLCCASTTHQRKTKHQPHVNKRKTLFILKNKKVAIKAALKNYVYAP